MTARINEKRHARPMIRACIKRFGHTRRQFLALSTKDARAFVGFSKVSKLRKQDPRYQHALKDCANPPLAMAELSVLCLRLAQSQIGCTSRWLASDLAEGVLLLEAAFQAACLNVEINLYGIQDKKYARKMRAHLRKLKIESARYKHKIMKGLGY